MAISVNNNLINYADVYKDNGLENTLDKDYSNMNDTELMDACKEFEAYFLEMVFKEMKKTVPDGGLFEKNTTQEYFDDMLMQEYAKSATEGEGVGLAKMLYEQRKRTNTSV